MMMRMLTPRGLETRAVSVWQQAGTATSFCMHTTSAWYSSIISSSSSTSNTTDSTSSSRSAGSTNSLGEEEKDGQQHDRNARILESIALLDEHGHPRDGTGKDVSSLMGERERGVPLTGFQRGLLSILSSWGAFRDPRRADLVAIVGEVTGEKALSLIRDRMRRSEEGRRVLEERPRVTDAATLSRAQGMPPHTFGGAYASFMDTRGFHADERPAVRFIDDPELAYVAARMREVHDFWHVLFDCHTDVLGEAALKAVEFMQTGMPMTGMAVIAAEWRLSRPKRKILNTVYLPWAVQAGAQAADLACLYYEEHLHRDLNDVREAWRILKRPIPPDS
mmetsp:Transcript_10260/g.20247  ORF Transcript_10260/g.20247 Transcript_10260/m.20247 type:complete len:335 (+) Transcript_10260:113-1117(+)